MSETHKRPALDLLEPPPFKSAAFDTDRLERRWAADLLTERLHLFAGGCVLCLDAPWGEGKTFFVKNWQASLAQAGTATIYIDAFERDYVDDPFLVVAAAIRGHLKSQTSSGSAVAVHFTDSVKRVSLALLPTATKLLVNGIGTILGAPGVGGVVVDTLNAAADGAEMLAERVIEERLEELDRAQSSVDALKAALTAYVSTLDGPLVIIIDELDRCSPQFAVRLLERIKHYFEVPKIVFVLSAHKAQLEAAIGGVYGQIDAAAYLNKFIHVTFHLPKKEQEQYARMTDIYSIIHPVMTQMTSGDQSSRDSSEVLATFATDLGMSIRDAQRAMMSVVLSPASHKLIIITAYLSCLRVIRPSIYRALKLKQKSGHERSLELIDSLRQTRSEYALSVVRVIHKEFLEIVSNSEEDKQAKKHLDSLAWDFGSAGGSARLLQYCFAGLDLTRSS